MLDIECDKQLTVVGLLLTALATGRCEISIRLMFGTKIPETSRLYYRSRETSMPDLQLHPAVVMIEHRLVTDRQTDRHKDIGS